MGRPVIPSPLPVVPLCARLLVGPRDLMLCLPVTRPCLDWALLHSSETING